MFGRKHRIEELQIMLRYDPNNRQALDELRSLIMSPPQPTTNTTVSLNTNVEDGEDEVSAPAEVNAADEETAEVNAVDETTVEVNATEETAVEVNATDDVNPGGTLGPRRRRRRPQVCLFMYLFSCSYML